MKYTEVIGEIYKHTREKKGYFKETVIKDLIGIKIINRFEDEEILPDFLMIERLYQRIGESSDIFTIMMTSEEYDYCIWRENLIEKIISGKICKSDWESRSAKDRTINELLQEQFVQFWKGYDDSDAELMKKAIRMTVPEFPDKMSMHQCIGREEFAYMLYYIERKLQKNPKEWMQEYETVRFILKYINLNYETRELVRIYARAACVYGELIPIDDIDDKIHHYKSALDLQRKYARVSGIDRLLYGLICSYKQLEQEIPDDYQKMYETIIAVKNEFKITENYAPEIKMTNEIYLLDEVFKEYRLERGLTPAQAAEGVCDIKTYRALENGKRKPKRGTYQAIAEALGIPLVKYNADIITNEYEHIQMLEEIKLISRKSVKGREQKLIDILEQKLGVWMKYPENRQMIDSRRDFQKFCDGNIEIDDYLDKLKNVLDMTINNWHKDMEHHFYTRRELVILYYVIVAYREKGRSDIAIKLMDKLLEYLNSSKVNCESRMEEIAVLYIERKNLLTDMEMYDEAIKNVYEYMKICFKLDRGDKIVPLLIEPGWICNEGYYQETMEMVDKEHSEKYFQHALCISEMYYQDAYQKSIKEYMKSIKISQP